MQKRRPLPTRITVHISQIVPRCLQALGVVEMGWPRGKVHIVGRVDAEAR